MVSRTIHSSAKILITPQMVSAVGHARGCVHFYQVSAAVSPTSKSVVLAHVPAEGSSFHIRAGLALGTED